MSTLNKTSLQTILIIDPDEKALLELQQALKYEGYNVITSTNSHAAQQLFIHHKPCVVVLQLFMPEKDGFELVQEIRSVCQKCFILALSFHFRYLQAIKRLGADEALHKASTLDDIVSTINSFHQKKSSALHCKV